MLRASFWYGPALVGSWDFDETDRATAQRAVDKWHNRAPIFTAILETLSGSCAPIPPPAKSALVAMYAGGLRT